MNRLAPGTRRAAGAALTEDVSVAASVENRLAKSGTIKYELLLVLVTVIWGSAFPAQQIGMAQGLGPMSFNAVRFALGCLWLVPLFVWRRETGRAARGSLPYKGCLAAGLFLFAAAGLQQAGLQYTSSANSGFITGFYILFVALLGLLFKHKAPKALWAGILVCLVGFYLLSVGADFTVSLGDWLTLASAVLWACQILAVDRIAGRGDPIGIAVVQFGTCAALSGIYAWSFERCTLAHFEAAAGAIAYAGILSVGIAYTLQVVCQKHCPPGPAAVIMSMEAIFAALAGYLVLDQTLTGRAMVGCGLILCGVLIVQLAPKGNRIEACGHKETEP
jgi:drug/metabolite transporter (DMT)-like permease